MRARAARQVGWAVAIGVAVAVGCSPAQTDPGFNAGSAAPRQASPALPTAAHVPDDFPKMLGCATEELGNPTDPAARAQLKLICDVTQAGLYALSQDTSLTADEQTHHALMMMGGALERMTGVLEQAAVVTPDAGTVP